MLRRSILFYKKPSNIIYYTSSGNSIVNPGNVFNVKIVSNVNVGGIGIITFEGSVTKIGSYAFIDCKNLVSITIPESITEIGNYAFMNCSGLVSVNILGNSQLTNIGNYAFYDCSSLTSITCEVINPPTMLTYSFHGVNKSIPVYVPADSINAYKTNIYWKNFTNIQAIS